VQGARAPKTKHTQNQNNHKEETMETLHQQEHTEQPAHDALMEDMESLGDSPKATKRRRNQRRELTDTNYEQWVRSVLGLEIRNIYTHPRGRVIYFESPKCLRDNGSSLSTQNIPPEESARLMVAMALAKGWKAVKLTGNPRFVEAAIRTALKSGLAVVPADEMQIGLIQEIKAEMAAQEIANSPMPPVTMAGQPVTPSLLNRLRLRRQDQGTLPSSYQPPRPRPGVR
jgi:hypothetical protein